MDPIGTIEGAIEYAKVRVPVKNQKRQHCGSYTR